MKTNAVDSTLGRPRYQWEQSKTDTSSRRPNSKEKNELFSVYVGNIPVDITKYELDDLFCDAGKVVDSFIVSPTNGHSNTYGFVRFRTLKEAYEAVEQKNNNFAGGRQIVVQLSSSTRNKLEADPKVKDDDRPLLQKEYPRVTQSSIEKEENAIIQKIKASVKRFKNNNKLNGDKNVEQVFRNIQNIIKMTINYPLSLTEPSYEDEIPCRGQTCMAERHVECPVVTTPQSARTSDVRFSAFQDDEKSLKTAAVTGGLPAQTLVDRNSPEILSSRRRKKVLEFLDSSSGEETMLHSQLKSFPEKSPKMLNSSGSSSTDDERCMISNIRGKYSSKEKESIFFNDVSYNAANTSVVEDNFVSSVPNGAFCQKIDEKKVAYSSFELSSMSLHQGAKQVCVEKKVDINDNVNNMSTIASVTPCDTFNEIAERNGFNENVVRIFQ
ncbi:uncharacterized protein LOC124446326 [Xenia sp. Carnegie-2017]|uniref:uncharacterized protein LOC124446326 n=1 Tax=Xenia sp. Carnegie-2017 TaxID=2897299 RepID=UPI001F03BA4C|nr:uncharacterized protein LOC124446326 [Xenia sp. Carnegie-2017]